MIVGGVAAAIDLAAISNVFQISCCPFPRTSAARVPATGLLYVQQLSFHGLVITSLPVI